MKTPTLNTCLAVRFLIDAHCYPKPLGNGSPAAIVTIRKLIQCGAIEPNPSEECGHYRTTPLGQAWIEALKVVPMPPPPAPQTVPLGENVTRSGLRARVLAIDAYGKYPVVAEVQCSQGSRNAILRRYTAEGVSRSSMKSLDLVGFEHHEIKSPIDTELEDLRRWKAEAIASMPDYPAIGEEMGLTIGDDVPSSILPYIRTLKAKLETAKQALQ